jgi:hypothetical protein
VISAVVALAVVWMFARYRVVFPQMASAIAVAALARWVTVPISTALVAVRGHWGIALLALFWPVIAGALGALTRPQVGRIQLAFMRALGYEPVAINPLDA